ncbi:13899_t:CDS:1, partial [Funneliformis caledonium]
NNTEIVKITTQTKHFAFEIRDKPAKIIQNNIISIPEEIHPYISLINAF